MRTVRYDEPCEDCLLDWVAIPTTGPKDSKILVITKPSKTKQPHPLSKRALTFFGKNMKKHGFSQDDFVFHNSVRCVYDAALFETKDKHTITKCCKEWFYRIVERMQPDLIIPLGSEAASTVMGRKVAIMKARGMPVKSKELKTWVLPMLDPEFVTMYPQHRASFDIDCKTLRQLIENDYDVAKIGRESLGDYQIIDDLQPLLDQKPRLLCYDIETVGEKHSARGAKILSMQFCTEEGKAYMVVWDHPEHPFPAKKRQRMLRQLERLLCHPRRRLVGQNLKYDAVWTLHHLGIRIRIYHDTLMYYTLLDENSTDKNMDMLVKLYVPEMAGYADCVTPDTEILTVDLRKVRAGDLRIGDELCAFTENTPGGKAERRRMEVSTVTGVQPLVKPCYRITTESGRTIEVSSGHLMLTKRGLTDAGGGWRWRKASKLKVGNVLKPFPWGDQASDYEAGYVSGMLDGEGWQHVSRLRVGLAQKPGQALDWCIHRIQAAGIQIGHRTDRRKEVPVVNLNMDGRYAIETLQVFRPERIIAQRKWKGAGVPTNNGMRMDRIVSVEFVGEKEVIGLQTTTQTIISNGLLSHNSFNQKYDKSRMDLVPLDELVDYGCGDVDACLRLLHKLLPLVEKDPQLLAHYEYVSRPALNAFVPIESEGMIISHENLDAFQVTMEESIKEQRLAVIKRLDIKITRKYIRKYGPADGLNFGRRDFLREILFAPPYGNAVGCCLTPRVWTKGTEKLTDDKKMPSTSTKDHLPFFFDHPEHGRFVMDLAQLLKDERLLGTNIVSFRNKYVYGDRIYPSYSLTTAVTGRTSSRDPNGQNFPKRGKNAKAYRRIFVPPIGWVLIEADLSQAELRIAADMANEGVMLDIYRRGGDIHRATACMAMRITEEEFTQLPKDEQKLARFKAKAINFGYIYGMGWRKFIIYAKTQYGIDYTDAEAQAIRNGYFRMFYNLPAWHKVMRSYAKRHGYVRSYSGRIRHLPQIYSPEEWIRAEAQRQAINSPVQEFGSSLGLISMGRIDQEVDRRYLKLVGFVHDALYAYVPKKYVEWGAKTLKYYMETNPVERWFGTEMACPIISDVGFGFDGSTMFEMDGLALGKKYDWQENIYDTKDWKEAGCDLLPAQKRPPSNGRVQVPKHMDLDIST